MNRVDNWRFVNSSVYVTSTLSNYIASTSFGIGLSTPAETYKLSIFLAYIANRLSSYSSSHIASTSPNPGLALTTSPLISLAYPISYRPKK